MESNFRSYRLKFTFCVTFMQFKDYNGPPTRHGQGGNILGGKVTSCITPSQVWAKKSRKETVQLLITPPSPSGEKRGEGWVNAANNLRGDSRKREEVGVVFAVHSSSIHDLYGGKKNLFGKRKRKTLEGSKLILRRRRVIRNRVN